MWLTIVICIDIFLAWLITSGICFLVFRILIYSGIPPSAFEIPFMIMEYTKIPSGFVLLVRYTPNLILIGVYFMYQPSKSMRFKCWWVWEYCRREWFKVNGEEIGKAKITEEEEEKEKKRKIAGEKDRKILGEEIGGSPPLSSPRIYALSPHGSYGEAAIIGFTLNPKFKHVTTISTSLLFWIPIVREFAYLAGAIPANSHNIAHELSLGHSIVLVPEGLRGIFYPSHQVLRGIPGESDARIGFIRCAMAYKECVIVPVYCHGIDKLYTNYNIFPWLQKKLLKTYYYPWPMLNFGWWGSFWPKPGELRYEFGNEIHLVNRDIMDVHKEYCDAIEKMSLKK